MIGIKQSGDYKNIEKFLLKAAKADYLKNLEKYGQEGVAALASATPINSGETAECWTYDITKRFGSFRISWSNSNVVDNAPIAVILQYGHGTANGGYVQGRDYINPAIQKIFDKIAEQAWKEVTNT